VTALVTVVALGRSIATVIATVVTAIVTTTTITTATAGVAVAGRGARTATSNLHLDVTAGDVSASDLTDGAVGVVSTANVHESEARRTTSDPHVGDLTELVENILKILGLKVVGKVAHVEAGGGTLLSRGSFFCH
jgi:hypothetical protein